MEDVEAKNSFCLEVAAYWEARQENEHAVSFQAVLEEVAEANSLVALFLGPDDGLHGDMHFPEVNRLRRAPRCVQERLDRRNTSWWLERKAKEQSKVQARLEQIVLPDTAGLTSIIQPNDTNFHQFLRAAAAQGAVPPPPPPALAIGREAQSSSVSFEAFLEEVEEAHCLVALFLGSDDGLHGDMHFPEVYRLRRTSRRVRQISYYDVHWLREWCWLCGCEGAYEDGAGCSMAWRQQAWICPLIFRCL